MTTAGPHGTTGVGVPAAGAARRGDDRPDADALAGRVAALDRFTQYAADHVPPGELAPARAVAERARGRLEHSGDHTVVALAGATGSGKSSLFNAIAGMELSAVGVRRPTTATTHACVWLPHGAGTLLDWLGVPPDRRFARESALDADDQAALHGLVLLDLPDFDSVHTSHRAEVDRLLALVDLVIWVTDPQKYADQVIHERYLRTFHRHAAAMAVVLNQADRLSQADTQRCLADLERLLAADGLDEVELYAVSATAPQPGTAALRAMLERAVSERSAALRRIGADVDEAAEHLAPLVGPPVDTAVVEDADRDLVEAFATSAGVPEVSVAAGAAYRQRAARWTGWPPARLLRRRRPDPLSAATTRPAATDGTGPPEATMPAHANATLAARALADRVAAGLPPPWPAAVVGAAGSRAGEFPGALDHAVTDADLGADRKPAWWRLVAAVQWLLLLAALAGAAWLVVRGVQRALGRPELRMIDVGGVPLAYLLLGGGLVAGILLALLVRPAIAAGARRATVRADDNLREHVAEAAGAQVTAPVRSVLADYGEARRALADATGGA